MISLTLSSIPRRQLLRALLAGVASVFALATASASANNIPGTPFPSPGPATGTLDATGTSDAVFSVVLNAGTNYKFSLVEPNKSTTGSEPIDFALDLFAPGAADVKTAGTVASANAESYYARVSYLEYTPTASGTYYIDARALDGNGAFTLFMGQVDSATEKCPGKRIKFGKTYSGSIGPATPRLCFSAVIRSKADQSFFIKGLSFNGTPIESIDTIGVEIEDPNGKSDCITVTSYGDDSYCSDLASDGGQTFRPSRTGLHTFAIQDLGPLTATFKYGVSPKVGTLVELSKGGISTKKRKGKYNTKLTARLIPRKTRAKVNFRYKKCNADGSECKLAKTATARLPRSGRVTVNQPLPGGRYEAEAVFKGAATRFGGTSDSVCLAVGLEASCAT